MLAELSLEPECRRGHGAVYDAVNCGEVRIARLRRALAALPLPLGDGRIRLAADVSNWLRPDAATSPDRLFCHCYAGQGQRAADPGLAVLGLAALEPGRTSWTLPLDAVRLGPADDATEVTAAQVREVVGRIIAAGHWPTATRTSWSSSTPVYDLTRLAWLLRDLPVEVLGRLRSDRVMYFPAPPRLPGTNGRPRVRPRLAGAASTRAGQRITWRAARRRRTLIRLHVDRLPGDRRPDRCGCGPHRPALRPVTRAWQAFLPASISSTCSGSSSRSGLGPARSGPGRRSTGGPGLIIACYVQLRLARGLARRHPAALAAALPARPA